MQDDLAALKKGQSPAGAQIERLSEKEAPQAPTMPKVIPPPAPTARVELGGLERAKSLPGSTSPGASAKPTPPPSGSLSRLTKGASLNVPAGSGLAARKSLILIIAVLIVAAGLVWFFLIRTPSTPEVAYSPSPTVSATARPSLERTFKNILPVNLSPAPDIFDQLKASTKEGELAQGSPRIYKLIPSGNAVYSLDSFVKAPDTVSAALEGRVYLSLLNKLDSSFGSAIIAPVKASADIPAAMQVWESTMSQDFKDLFGLDTAKAASPIFLDNTYQGTAIRYRNFPDPKKTIDYTVVSLADGSKYLIIANSREHIYALIDGLLGFTPGK